jgi:hypothetical protein
MRMGKRGAVQRASGGWAIGAGEAMENEMFEETRCGSTTL